MKCLEKKVILLPHLKLVRYLAKYDVNILHSLTLFVELNKLVIGGMGHV